MNETIPSQNTLAAVDTNNNKKPIISTDAEGIISGGNTSSNTLSPQLCEEDIQTSSSPSSSSPSSKKNRMMLKKNSSCNRSRRKIAMMEQREALSAIKPEGGGAAAARPGLGARSNTIGTTKFLRFLEHENNEEEDEDEDKSSSSFSRDILLDNHRKSNMSMPSLLGVSSTKPTEAAAATSTTTKSSLLLFPQQHHCRQVQNLSFADAKKIWMREWRTSQQEQQRRQYSFSSFDDDLEKSLRQAPSLRSIDTLVSSTVSDSHNSHTMTGHGSSRTAVTMVLEGDEQTVVQPIITITKHVRFSTITIQEYPIIPGCHPGGSSGGIPITIDWIPYDAVSIPLESYEKWRVPHLREKGEMRIPSKHREMILRSLGFAPKVLQAAAKEAAVVRKQRSKSNSMERMDKTSEQLEATIRGIQNFLTLGKKKRKERAFLARHVPSYENATAAAATTAKAGSNTGSSNNSRRASTPVLPTSRPPKSFMDSSRRASTPPEVQF